MNTAAKFSLGLLAAAATGAGMVLLFPPFHLAWLVWVVFAPVLFFVWSLGPKKRFRKGFGIGLLAGTIAFLGIFSWLRTVTDLGWAVLCVYLGLFPACWAGFVAKLADPRAEPEGITVGGSLRRAFWVAAMWCGTEWLRGWLFTGFGWNGLGVAFHETPVFAQSADLFGVIGLSFLPVFVQAVAVQVMLRMLSKTPSSQGRPHYDLAVAVLLIGAAVGYGRWRVSNFGKDESVRLKALMVQLDIKQDKTHRLVENSAEIPIWYEDETIGALHDLPAAKKPDWVVWPESALDGRILRLEDGGWGMFEQNFESLRRINAEGTFTTLMGLVEMEGVAMGDQIVPKEKDAKAWNSLAVFPPPHGEPPVVDLQTFKKHHLVIFGEWIPFIDQLPFLKKIYEEQSGDSYGGSFARGESLEPLDLKVKGQDVQVIPTVCFEDSVGRLVRKFRRDAPQVMVNVTNDGWFKESIGAEQHFANARFRSIELRRPLIRCANSGVTAAVDTLGLTRNPDTGKRQELRDENGQTFFRGHLMVDVDIPKHPQWTLYAVIGDWGVIVAALGSWLWAVIVARRNRPQVEELRQSFG